MYDISRIQTRKCKVNCFSGFPWKCKCTSFTTCRRNRIFPTYCIFPGCIGFHDCILGVYHILLPFYCNCVLCRINCQLACCLLGRIRHAGGCDRIGSRFCHIRSSYPSVLYLDCRITAFPFHISGRSVCHIDGRSELDASSRVNRLIGLIQRNSGNRRCQIQRQIRT